MKILGVDPGLNCTGYGLLSDDCDGLVLVEAGVLRSKTTHPLEKRLNDLFAGMEEIIAEFTPDVVAVEELYSHYQHPRTAVIMGHARGVFILAAGRVGLTVYSYSATRIKKSLTGSGRATKEQVSRMIGSLVNCEMSDVPNDATDAIAVALCHVNAISHGYVL